MADVNKTQYNKIPSKWAFDEEIGPFIRSLLRQIDQIRDRTGGDDDTVASVDAISSTNFYAGGLTPEDKEIYFDFQTFEEAPLAGEKSVNNSTTAALSGGASFNASSDGEVNDWNYVFVSLKTDAPGTLYIEFSNDLTGTINWDSSISYEVSAGIPEPQPLFKGGRRCRVRYVNGSSAQTYFRMGTYYCDEIAFFGSRLNSSIAKDAAAQLVRSIGPETDLAFGRIDGQSEDTKFGFVRGVDAADNACTVWAFADDTLATRSDRKPWPTSAATLYIASDAAGDTSLEFTVEVIDGSGVRTYEVVSTDATDGTTPVAFATSAGMDVNRVILTGDTQSHAGNIYITNVNDFTAGVPNDPTNDVLAFIPIGYGQTQQGAYYVPDGYSCRIKSYVITVSRASGAAGSAEVLLLVKAPGESWVTKREYSSSNGSIEISSAGLVFSPNTRWEWVVGDNVSDTDTNVSIDTIFELVE